MDLIGEQVTDDPSINFLNDPDGFRQLLEGIGLKEVAWNDTTEKGIETQRQRLAAAARAAASGNAARGIGVLMDSDYSRKMANILPNYVQGRTIVVTSVFERS